MSAEDFERLIYERRLRKEANEVESIMWLVLALIGVIIVAEYSFIFALFWSF